MSLALASTVAIAAPSTHERLTSIAEAYIAAIADDDPLIATALGLPGADRRLTIRSEPAQAARIARLDRWKAEVEATTQAAGNALSLVQGQRRPSAARRIRLAEERAGRPRE